MLRRVANLALQVVCFERGAVLWIPCLLAATYLVLFAIHLTPNLRFFNRMTALRVLVGPWSCDAGEETQRGLLLGALRRGLEPHAEFALVDSTRVARWLVERPAADAQDFLQVTRALNAQICLTGELATAGTLEASARLEAWDPRGKRRLLRVEVRGAGPEQLGRALAESLAAAVFRPRTLTATTP